MNSPFVEFLRGFAHSFPRFAPPLALSWIVVLGLELFVGKQVRGHLRPHILRVDEHLRSWALSKRFGQRGELESERVGRTWFMRFWTNFASAPSLCVLALALAVWAYATHQVHPTLWSFPGVVYLGSMAQSYVTKRLIKRVRPPRKEGSFGFKMKDSSFPSGHSLTSFCFWFSVVLASAFSGAAAPVVGAVLLVALITVGFTGFSRVYMGVHFPSDVFGGFLMGLVWTLVCAGMVSPALRGF